MNQVINEQLSALMDGELARDETRFLLRRIGTAPGSSGCWVRYHVTRQVLRHQAFDPACMHFAAGVGKALTDAAPLPVRRPWLRWASGGAIAAGVAVAALMVSRPTADLPVTGQVAESTDLPSAQVDLASKPAPAIAASVSTPEFQAPLLMPGAPSLPASASTRDAAEPVSFDPHLQSYLLRHYEASGASGQGGFLPYVLLVVPPQQAARQPEYPPQSR
jgi:sigma-E factor negative regulatory protein RseA